MPALSEPNKRKIREEYLGATNFCDGDIYRHFRRCVLQGNHNENQWLARLSDSKRRDVLQLNKAADRDGPMREFRDCLDSLLPFPGLWPALHIGTFHRLLTLRCPEELAHYLRRIRETWLRICGHDSAVHSQLDAQTVKGLEGRCLYLSTEDTACVETLMAKREIFPFVSSQSLRTRIMAELRAINFIIPSLHTFLEDTKYMEPCAQIMKSILPYKFRGTIQQGFDKSHNGQLSFQEQIDEMSFLNRSEASEDHSRWKAYRQLWLFAFRHFPEMTGFPPRRDAGRPRPSKLPLEHTWWHRIASLAEDCGYKNVRVLFPEVEDADVRMTQQFLRQARPSQYFRFDDGIFDAEVLRICQILRDVKAKRIIVDKPHLSSDRESGCGPEISFRCGRPREISFYSDRQFLFLDYVYGNESEETTKRFLTTYAVTRCIFHNFFGNLHDFRRLPVFIFEL